MLSCGEAKINKQKLKTNKKKPQRHELGGNTVGKFL